MTLPYIQEFADRHGVTRRYVRRNSKRIRLKTDPNTEWFLAEYQTAMKLTEKEVRSAPTGTWYALIAEYKTSNTFTKKVKTPKSREERLRACREIGNKWGTGLVAVCNRADVERWMDRLGDTPGKANNILRTLKRLLTFGEGRGFTFDRSILRIEKLPLGEWRSWTDLEMQIYEAKWPAGTIQRLAYDLALYTGQRKADMMDMTREHIDDDVIGVAQRKTGERLAVPFHPYLKASIKAFKSNGLALLQDANGLPLASRALHDIVANAIDAAELANDCVLHGLRKASARKLAEAGCTTHEIMAITGHKTMQMVEHYTRGANQKRLAKKAMLKLWKDRRK